MDRRDFIQLLTASMALIATGCRRPKEEIVPMVTPVEYMLPGEANEFSSVFMHGFSSIGTRVTLREGRPIKLDGDFFQPLTIGGSSPILQAVLYDLYDPDRFRSPRMGKQVITLDESISHAASMLEAIIKSVGKTAVLTDIHSSPSYNALARHIESLIPNIKFFMYDPIGASSTDAILNKEIYGYEGILIPDLYLCNTLLTIDSDILGADNFSIYYNKCYAGSREMHTCTNAEESGQDFLHLAIESGHSITGANADKRYAVRSEEIEMITRDIMNNVIRLKPGSGFSELEFTSNNKSGNVPAEKIARKLVDSNGKACVIAGGKATYKTRLFTAIINRITSSFEEVGIFNLWNFIPVDSKRVISEAALTIPGYMVSGLSDFLSNEYDFIIFAGSDPYFSAGQRIKGHLNKTPIANRISINLHRNSTSEAAGLAIPQTHFLENWGDALTFNKEKYIQQPVIAPLNENSISIQDFLIRMTKAAVPDAFVGIDDYYSFLRSQYPEYSKTRVEWKEFIRSGSREILDIETIKSNSQGKFAFNMSIIDKAVQNEHYEIGKEPVLVASLSPYLYDGRYANNPWLQELPHPITKQSWGCPVTVNPLTAKEYGLEEGDLVKIKTSAGTAEFAVHLIPGLADKMFYTEMGYGSRYGNVAALSTGSNVFLILSSSKLFTDTISIRKTGRKAEIPSAQKSLFAHGRPVVKLISSKDIEDDDKNEETDKAIRSDIYPGYDYLEGRWKMTIDLDRCTGCNACVIACQVENNIPFVGPDEAGAGRLMHWLRIDRYFTGSDDNPGRIVFLPMLCQHCLNAPCEPVCPVGASTHSPEGINETTYNRCVGSRFCMANCPYKVRRFNFRDYTSKQSKYLAPAYNPSVTVRSQGVVEKCTFCVQRINKRRILLQSQGKEGLDNYTGLSTACSEACPANAIGFEFVNDKEQSIEVKPNKKRSFRILEELNTKPSVVYLARIIREPGF